MTVFGRAAPLQEHTLRCGQDECRLQRRQHQLSWRPMRQAILGKKNSRSSWIRICRQRWELQIAGTSAVRCTTTGQHLHSMKRGLRFIVAPTLRPTPWETEMAWKAPKIVEVPVGMEINMYACAARK